MKTLRLLVSILLIFPIMIAKAQSMEVEKMEMVSELNEGFPPDMKGIATALIEVAGELENASFEGSVIKVDKEVSGHYLVYVSEGTKMIRIKASGQQPKMITFDKYGVKNVKSKARYLLSIKKTNEINLANKRLEEVEDKIEKPKISYSGDLSNTMNFTSEEKGVMDSDMALSNKNHGKAIKEYASKGYYKAIEKLLRDRPKNKEYAQELATKLVEVVPLNMTGDIGNFLLSEGYEKEAFNCFAKNADDNMSFLGKCYEHGIGVEKDIDVAILCYRWEAVNGHSREDLGMDGLIRLNQYVCSKEALETQQLDIINKTEKDLKNELKKTLSYSNGRLRDFPKAFALWKVLADIYNDNNANQQMARAYSGKGGFPVKDEGLAKKYSDKAYAQYFENQRKYLNQTLIKMKKNIESNDFFSNLSEVKIGDFYYNDGSFSHNYNPDKNAIGVVAILNDEKFKQSQQKNGYILSLIDAPDQLGRDLVYWEDVDWAIETFNNKYPSGNVLNWFLPSGQEFDLAIKNLLGIPLKKDFPWNFETKIPYIKGTFTMELWTADKDKDGFPMSWFSGHIKPKKDLAKNYVMNNIFGTYGLKGHRIRLMAEF